MLLQVLSAVRRLQDSGAHQGWICRPNVTAHQDLIACLKCNRLLQTAHSLVRLAIRLRQELEVC